MKLFYHHFQGEIHRRDRGSQQKPQRSRPRNPPALDTAYDQGRVSPERASGHLPSSTHSEPRKAFVPGWPAPSASASSGRAAPSRTSSMPTTFRADRWAMARASCRSSSATARAASSSPSTRLSSCAIVPTSISAPSLARSASELSGRAPQLLGRRDDQPDRQDDSKQKVVNTYTTSSAPEPIGSGVPPELRFASRMPSDSRIRMPTTIQRMGAARLLALARLFFRAIMVGGLSCVEADFTLESSGDVLGAVALAGRDGKRMLRHGFPRVRASLGRDRRC